MHWLTHHSCSDPPVGSWCMPAIIPWVYGKHLMEDSQMTQYVRDSDETQFTDKEGHTETVSSLPKVTQLVASV